MEVQDYQENYKAGWISLYRSIQRHWIYENDKYFKWWVVMLFDVNHSDNKFTRDYKVHTIKRGQSVNSLRRWSELFLTTPKTVSKFFKLLESDGMIKMEKIGKGKQSLTLITIKNYGNYQGASKQDLPQEVNKKSTKGKQDLPTNNNDNNEKELLLDKFKHWAVDSNLDQTKVEDAFLNAWDYYESLEWKDKNGKEVKNKQQKIRTVWFKDLSKFRKELNIDRLVLNCAMGSPLLMAELCEIHKVNEQYIKDLHASKTK